ncbi:hypothetical protein X753_28285 [Mesorhizobium sp. LNJC399B00]|nr:hypothetical protein X753_28285 [Mesorhizobium sp. LNJC399B00]
MYFPFIDLAKGLANGRFGWQGHLNGQMGSEGVAERVIA